MMKRIIIFSIFLIFAAVSCQQEPQGELKLSTEEETMGSDGGVINLTVESNYRWTCNSGTKDIIISQKSGDAGTTGITVTVPGNPGEAARSIEVKFNCENAKAVLNVSQAGSRFDTLTVMHSSYYFPAISFDGTGFTGKINWGDGESGDFSYYSPMPSHEYSRASDYTVTVTTHDTEGFFLETMKGVSKIDLTKF